MYTVAVQVFASSWMLTLYDDKSTVASVSWRDGPCYITKQYMYKVFIIHLMCKGIFYCGADRGLCFPLCTLYYILKGTVFTRQARTVSAQADIYK